jgi:hypothetical protein
MCGAPAIGLRQIQRLFVFVARSATATMGRATTRCCGVRGAMGRATVLRCGMGGMGRADVRGCGMGIAYGGPAVGPATAPGAYGRWPTSTIGSISTSTAVSTAGDVPASSCATEAMITPAVAIAPACPWTHTQEDAVIEIARPIKATGCAAVRCIVVVAV